MTENARLRARFQVLVSDILEGLRGRLTYRELEEITGKGKSRLSRYATGTVLPSYEVAREIWEGLRRAGLPARLVAESVARSRGFLDLSRALSDPALVKMLVLEFMERFRGSGVTKILVPEASGIPLAAGLSWALNVGLVVARRAKENPLEDYIEESVVESPRVYRIFYVPRGMLGPGDVVLIVDDVVQTGYTLAALGKLVERAGARLAGVAAVVVVGEEWRRRARVGRVEAILSVTKP